MKSFTHTITADLAGKRIDQIPIEGLSRSFVSKYGTFLIDGEEKPQKTRVVIGEVWEVCINEPENNMLAAWNTPLKILKDSKTWAVIEKPIGVSVHPSSSERSQETIVNALIHHFGDNLAEHFDAIDGVQIPKLGLVHRLDKTTSGVLLIAKTNQTLKYFQDHWKDVTKIYTAVVLGKTPNRGRIEADITRNTKDRTKMMVTSNGSGKPSLTTFETLATEENESRLLVKLHTGRTHQIRVHLSSIGFPIIGDTTYGGPTADRIYLHAKSLEFPDPDNNEVMVKVQAKSVF